MISKRFVFATIYYVESFVEKHYQQQLEILKNKKKYTKLEKFIKKLQDDEVDHKDEAMLGASNFNRIHEIWGSIIGFGSELAVRLSKKV